MSAFFRPWRRRIGVLTLLIAMVFMALWLRSIRTEDVVSMKTRNGRFEYLLISSNSDLRVWRWKTLLHWPNPWYGQFVKWQARASSSIPAIDIEEPFQHWILFGISSESGPERHTGRDGTGLRIPYWLIVLHLTLISTSLFLSKSRQP